ncbi:M28 family metallopeptidase [Alteriqipengyuania lutimaris]|uniref:Peptidase M28 n=1 Tax=Alteriqipengyuania lutimaris TaxID=1538146 RepID=A0A395LJM2_9SPHN|nr:M28 family metallopeptidase [Alteriqipengyuania lutimaris]MBB3034211.1 Zn-dependent M28 family amino/carboxypeptidase [Alteriqipengyuania lutimaris]RDS76869.1 peptidase M28 [Alteriqipengyuania lutimaris]
MKRILAVATLALALAGCDAAVLSGGGDSEAALDIPDVGVGDISQETMVDVTRELSSDAFEGRMPGTEGGRMTVELLTERFEAAGLEPGNNGSWTQDVPLVEITGSDYAPLSITGGDANGMAFEHGDDWVGVSYRETERTRINNSELVFVGYGINAPERGWNDYEGIDMEGKTAVILVNDPDFGAEDLEGPFDGKAMTYYGRWTYKYEEAARQGAAAALIIHESEPASYGWNVVESSWSGPQGYPQRGDNAPPTTKMNGWIQNAVAERIFDAAGQDLDALKEAARNEDFTPVALGLNASTSFTNESREYMSQNVIGILPGAKRPEEYVLYTAHWDHLGRCTPADDGDDICNGAVDNATGTAALVALAEAQAKAGAADRSMVFLAVTAEEQGLLGSTYYAQNPVYPLDQTVGGVNMDAFLIAGPARDVTVVGPGKSQLDQFLEAALEADGRVSTANPNPEAGYYYRSDHFPFAKQGVPMLYIDGGEDLIEGGSEAGAALAADYRDSRYHGPKDEFDEEWDWSGVMADLQLYYRLGRMMAMSTSWPNWVEGDEFRSIRDESCAATNQGC